MNISLYITSDENNKLVKNLSSAVTFEGTLREESSIIDPVFNLEGENLTAYNYCYIPSFGRYYFITNITSVRNNLWRIECHVDVLMSYSNNIGNIKVILERTQDTEKEYYLGSQVWEAKVKTFTDIVSFPNGLLENGEFILITAGG